MEKEDDHSIQLSPEAARILQNKITEIAESVRIPKRRLNPAVLKIVEGAGKELLGPSIFRIAITDAELKRILAAGDFSLENIVANISIR